MVFGEQRSRTPAGLEAVKSSFLRGNLNVGMALRAVPLFCNGPNPTLKIPPSFGQTPTLKRCECWFSTPLDWTIEYFAVLLHLHP